MIKHTLICTRRLACIQLVTVLLLVTAAAGAQPPDAAAASQETGDAERSTDRDGARTAPEPGSEERGEARASAGGPGAGSDTIVMSPSQRRLSMLIGAPVIDSDGTEIGEIEELISADGSIDAVVLAIGGIVGIGERLVLVHWDELDIADTGAEQDAGEPQYRVSLLGLTGDQLADSRPEFRYDPE